MADVPRETFWIGILAGYLGRLTFAIYEGRLTFAIYERILWQTSICDLRENNLRGYEVGVPFLTLYRITLANQSLRFI